MDLEKESTGLWRDPAFPPDQLNPLALAYIGDAVFEVYIRQYVLSKPNHRPQVLHKRASSYVSAKAQSKALNGVMPLITEEEASVVKRGRNAKSGTAPKNADVLEYRHSTAFECLIGYLYYHGRYERLAQIMEYAVQTIEKNSEAVTEVNGKEDEGGRISSR